MPQLDTLTYFSQYVWLVITFASVYYFAIEFIIPSTASALKLRSKLNSSKLLNPTLWMPLAESAR
jgi:F0F1-type ATP synthase membrane subunit b/b'